MTCNLDNSYDNDVIAWANEQARLLRAGRFNELDIEHIVDEIEDVGKSEQRDLQSRMAVLLVHLLKWQYQPDHRGSSWAYIIRIRREAIARRLQRTRSLNVSLNDPEWWADAWGDALMQVANETELSDFPDFCPENVLQFLNAQKLNGESTDINNRAQRDLIDLAAHVLGKTRWDFMLDTIESCLPLTRPEKPDLPIAIAACNLREATMTDDIETNILEQLRAVRSDIQIMRTEMHSEFHDLKHRMSSLESAIIGVKRDFND
jgi:Domain of unknown function DUF29